MHDPSINPQNVFSSLIVKLECLQNDLFLGRLSLQRGMADDGALLSTSFELVSLLVRLWSHMDMFFNVRVTFEWIVGVSPLRISLHGL